jgi:hypothetical protein
MEQDVELRIPPGYPSLAILEMDDQNALFSRFTTMIVFCLSPRNNGRRHV